MKKIMTIVGTRPELIKMSLVIKEMQKHTNHILVHTGQNYDFELNEIFFKDLGISKPDYFLNASGKSAAGTIGQVIEKSDEIMKKERPDAVLLYGDTNSCLAVISAKRNQIPVFHMEAGNRCFDQRVPEELNRKVLDHLSDVNFVLTEHARRYLISEGLPQELIIKTGSHMQEVLDHFMPQILKSNILSDLNLKEKEFFLVSAHREENVDYKENLDNLVHSLNAVAHEYNMPVIVSTHPRTRSKLDDIKDSFFDDNIKFMKPMGFFDYVFLQMKAKCVISDSGTIFEESSLLRIPSITIRNAHERPEGNDEGLLIMSGLIPEDVLSSIKVCLDHYGDNGENFPQVKDYMGEFVSRKILKIVLSYIPYINRTIWKKS